MSEPLPPGRCEVLVTEVLVERLAGIVDEVGPLGMGAARAFLAGG